MNRHPRFVVGVLVLAAGTLIGTAAPNRYGHSDRVERHMLPSLSTTPLDPAWSPDGKWLAFSMRGDIWKVPAEGGEAIALTKGPAYHYEPAWSPDGSRIALTLDVAGNLDIGVVSANGGDVERLTTDRRVDVEPAWSHDGASLYFVTARAGNFDIYRYRFDDRSETPFIAGPRDQLQPAESPDGQRLAFVSPVDGRLGTGGIWVRPVAGGEPTLVHYEETEYRARPAWTPDGQAILYGSDEAGSNDIALVPATGGNPITLTADSMGEFMPAVAPDGSRFAFISNRVGPATLYTAPIGGGPLSAWTEVLLRTRTSRVATGRVRGRVLDAAGKPVAARIYPLASDGRAYAPDGSFHRVIAITETHYFHTTGEFEFEAPQGELKLEAMRGFEYRPAATTVQVPAKGVVNVTLRPERLIDAPAHGWYSGDTHIHDLHQGLFGLSHQQFFDQLRAEDLHVTNALIHMDGTRLMGRWADLTGKPHPLSTADYILQYSEEFRGSLGHIAMLGLKQYVLPFNAGEANTPYAQPELDLKYLDGARTQSALAGYVHPYTARDGQPGSYANSLIPVDVALGKGDFYDIGALFSDEIASAQMYYRLLNCGFRLPATSGTDNFSDVWRDPPPGADRAYVQVRGRLTLASWFDGIKAQRTFGTTGPLVFLDVEGRGMGEEIALSGSDHTQLKVKADAVSIAPLETLEIVANGKVVGSVKAGADLHKLTLATTVDLSTGGWIAARASGPSSRYISDSYAFAQSSPVYVVRNGKRFTSPDDARFLAEVVDALWARVDGQRARWRTSEEREKFKAAIDQARQVYLGVAGGSR